MVAPFQPFSMQQELQNETPASQAKETEAHSALCGKGMIIDHPYSLLSQLAKKRNVPVIATTI
jgi:hypothetical protein